MRSNDPQLEQARAEYEEAVDAVLNPAEGFVTTRDRDRLRAALTKLQTLEAHIDDRPTAAELRAARPELEREAYERKLQDDRYKV